MSSRKCILFVVVMIALHQPAAALVSRLVSEKASAGCWAFIGLAWAEETTRATSETTVSQQEMKTAPTSSQLSAKPLAPETPAKPEERQVPSGFIDMLHGQLSHELLSTAVWLDSFFGDERYLLEQNQSYLRVRYDLFQEERAKILLRPSVDMRLAMPQLEQKAHIVLSAEPNEIPRGATTPLTPTGERIGATDESNPATTDERNFTAALHYLFRSTPGESFIVRTGLQFSKFSPVLYVAPRYRSLIPLQEWNFRITQEEVYRTDTGWQTETTLDFERKLPHDFFFRTSIDGNWYANTNGYFCSLTFSLREVFNATHALDYEWVNSYQARPVNELAEIDFRIRYRHSFWREWLFYEVAPQIRFPRAGNFDIVPGILFRFEMFFGRIAG